MANLVFYDKDHKYEVDDVELPSVSEITRFISREVYQDSSQFKVDNAGERGSKIHRAIEQLIRFGSAKIDNSIQPYIQAFLQFVEDYKPKWLRTETAYASQKHQFAGTVDAVAEISAGIVIFDWKSDSSIDSKKKEYYGAKLNAYKILVEENESFKIDKIYLLHLKKDGTYGLKRTPLMELEVNPDTFMACLRLHNIFRKKDKKEKDNEIIKFN